MKQNGHMANNPKMYCDDLKLRVQTTVEEGLANFIFSNYEKFTPPQMRY